MASDRRPISRDRVAAWMALAVTCTGTLILSGCGNGPPAGASGASSAASSSGSLQPVQGVSPSATVKETDALRFVPAGITVKAGTVVEWSNSGSIAHNVTFDNGTASPTMSGGDTYEVRFAEPGSFRYVCTFHVASGMEGKVTVTP